MAESEDRPIIIVGGPQMINVELPRSSKNNPQPGKFSIKPDDPGMPFQEIVVWDGEKELLRWPLSKNWKIEIA